VRKLKLMAMIAISAALLVGCSTAGASAKSTSVNVALADTMKITVDRNSVPAGLVTFVVKNNGLLEHELVVIKTDVAEDKLAPDTSEPGKMDEAGNMGETGDMIAGASNTFTITLPAGHYVLMCNEVGHYVGGMHLNFTVN
jgi:uncharacterized cupredoxin-like copper-binding protein